MKPLISFKSLLIIVFSLSAGIFSIGCRKDNIQVPASGSITQQIEQTSTQDAATAFTTERIYLDLTKDQMVAGGITQSMLQNYLNKGYQLGFFKKDSYAKHVSFKNKDGIIYYKDGWLKKGTECLAKPNNPFIVRQGGNVIEEHDVSIYDYQTYA